MSRIIICWIACCAAGVMGTTGGQSLSSRPSPAAANTLDEVLAADATLRDVVFVDPQHGWAVGDRGVVLATDDGGANWYAQCSGVDCPLLSVTFADAERGWIVGGAAIPMTHRTEGVVLRTIDGGATWQRIDAPTLPRLTHAQFFDAAHGVAAGYGSSFYPAGLFTTSDGGKSWQPLGSAEQRTWLAADFVAPGSGLVAGPRGRRAAVIDRELRPVPLANTEMRRARGVAMTSATTGWMVGDDGLVQRSTDAGATWQPPATPPLAMAPPLDRGWNWKAVAAVGERMWLAGGPGSVVVRSDDGGETWRAATTGVRAAIHAMTFVDHDRGWAVGAMGTILGTSDGGQTWRVVRGGGRAAMLVATAAPEAVPLEIITRYAAGEGYRTAVLPLFEQVSSDPHAVDTHRSDEAFASIAATACPALWSGEVPPAGYHASADTLLAELNRQTDGLARGELTTALAIAIRTWRPEVLLVPHERDPARHASSALVEQLALDAIRMAADPTQNAELAMVGLEAWQVKRVVGLLPTGERGSVRLPTDDFLPSLGGSPAGWNSAARGLLFRKHTVPPSLDELELLGQQDGIASTARDLFAGLNLPPGCDARRARVESNPADLDRLRRLTQQRRQLVRLLDYAEGSPVWSAQVVNLTGGLDAQSGGELMFQLAEGYRETGRHAMAADTLYLLARRYPDHPLTEQALTWLVRYYASGEVAHVASREQAKQARTQPLANAGHEAAGVRQASAELPTESGGGTAELTADERLQRATMLGGYSRRRDQRCTPSPHCGSRWRPPRESWAFRTRPTATLPFSARRPSIRRGAPRPAPKTGWRSPTSYRQTSRSPPARPAANRHTSMACSTNRSGNRPSRFAWRAPPGATTRQPPPSSSPATRSTCTWQLLAPACATSSILPATHRHPRRGSGNVRPRATGDRCRSRLRHGLRTLRRLPRLDPRRLLGQRGLESAVVCGEQARRLAVDRRGGDPVGRTRQHRPRRARHLVPPLGAHHLARPHRQLDRHGGRHAGCVWAVVVSVSVVLCQSLV